MSFSSDVKEELANQFSTARHCQIAEIAAIITMCGEVHTDDNQRFQVSVRTENVILA